MSEYCYQCQTCGEFKNDCKCPDGFKDPLEMYKDMSPGELEELLNPEPDFDEGVEE